MLLNLEEYIKVYNISLPEGFLESLINSYEKNMKIATIGDNVININHRNCLVENINNTYHTYVIYQQVDKCLKEYTSINKFITVTENHSGYAFLKYESGCYFREHIDQGTKNNKRVLSMIINLNEDYTGGEIGFFNNNYKLTLKKNQAIIFPSNFLFPHQVNTILTGCRYSIVTWFY